MRNINFWSGFGFAVFTLVALTAITVSLATYSYANVQKGGFLAFLATNHLWIMLITILIALVYGFSSSLILQQRLKEEKNTSKNILDIVLSFLSKEESNVIKHLIEHNGRSTQQKISHINNMGAVKALRTVQKMNEKKLVEIEKNGKVRKIILKPEIQELLDKPRSST